MRRVQQQRRWWFAANAILAWAAIGLRLVLTTFGIDESAETVPSRLGYANPEGMAGALPRIFDFLTYFTIWSNIVVAVALTMLWRRPDRDDPVLRAVRLAALLMISITGLVYGFVLAGDSHPQGWSWLADLLLHKIVPILTVVVWLVVGPRRWTTPTALLGSLTIPAVWIVMMFVRGATIGAYPYPFTDVVVHGYGTVLLNLVGVLVLALVLFLIFWAVDLLLSRTRSSPPPQGG